MSAAQLRDSSNGIWCCTRHAAFIDANAGNGLDAATLRSYRSLAEARAALESDGIAAPGAGWFHELQVRAGPNFVRPFVLRLGKSTVVVGDNATGKTLLADMLSGVGLPERWSRWRSGFLWDDLAFEVDYFDPAPQRVEARISASAVHRSTNGAVDASIARPIGIVRYSLNSQDWPKKVCDIDEDEDGREAGLSELARAVGEDPEAIRSAVSVLHSRGIHDVRVVDEDQIEARLPHTPGESESARIHHFAWPALSATERLRIGLETAMAIAAQRAKDQPTLLIVDDLAGIFDDRWERYAFELLSEPGLPYQTLVLACDPPPVDIAPRWTTAALSGRPPCVALDQPTVVLR